MFIIKVKRAGSADETPVQVMSKRDQERLINIHGSDACSEPIDTETGEVVELPEVAGEAQAAAADGPMVDPTLTPGQLEGEADLAEQTRLKNLKEEQERLEADRVHNDEVQRKAAEEAERRRLAEEGGGS